MSRRDNESFVTWLLDAAVHAGIARQVDLRTAWKNRYGRELSTTNATMWWNGRRVPKPRQLTQLAELFGADPAAAFAAAYTAESTASRWSRWLRERAQGTHYDLDLVDLSVWLETSKGALDEATVAAWRDGRGAPTAVAAALAAMILGADGVEALRVAGFPEDAKYASAMNALRVNNPQDEAARALDRYELSEPDRQRILADWSHNVQDGNERAYQMLVLQAEATVAKSQRTDNGAAVSTTAT